MESEFPKLVEKHIANRMDTAKTPSPRLPTIHPETGQINKGGQRTWQV
jgi:hypothetical protein